MKVLLIAIILFPTLAFGQIEQELLSDLNAARQKKHRKPLTYDVRYQAQTDSWGKHISKALCHDRKTHYYGETIGQFLVPELIIEQFLSSPRHKEILMDKDAERICISVYTTERDQTILYNCVIRTYR